MLRLSDARMSGTSYGACILHIAPESFVGGPLALIQNGDMIEVDIPNRSLNVDLSEAELPSAGATGLPQFPDTNAVMGICTHNISNKPIKDVISISYVQILGPPWKSQKSIENFSFAIPSKFLP